MKAPENQIWALVQWWAAVVNELRQLVRDRAGLILLFLMPSVLVLVITLVQDPLLKQEGGGFRIDGLVVDQDQGPSARTIVQALSQAGGVTVDQVLGDRPVDLAAAREAVTRGDYQFYLVVPPHLSSQLDNRLGRDVNELLTGSGSEGATPADLPALTVCFDPAIRSSYRAAISGAVRQAAATMETAYSLRHMGEALNMRMGAMGGQTARTPAEAAGAELSLEGLMIQRVSVMETTAGPDPFANLPTSVQQNVPAWALFGMFFIVVPLSTSLIRERRDGIVDRLRTMPVSLVAVVLGKLTAYACICMVQFVCIVLVGKWILPLLGTDELVLGDKLLLVALIAWCSALAATGYGILLGSLARTHEQATVVGPVSVVIAAALGGIMVPVFAMPRLMQTLSQGSPLGWAHHAFMTLLIRHGSWSAVGGRLLLLLLFFIITAVIGGLVLGRRH